MKQIEPYRVFFLLGLAFGIGGVAIWIPFGFGWSHFYPALVHPHLMIGGFLGSFAFGFLMTAVPRFTASFPAQQKEILSVTLPLLGLPLSLVRPEVGLGLLLLSFLALVVFGLRRFIARKATPHAAFIFLVMGLIAALSGLVLEILGTLGVAEVLPLGRFLFLHCFMMALVVGVGTRLVPMLLGWGAPPSRPKRFTFFAIAFFLSFFMEWWGPAQLAVILRATLVSWIFIHYWHIAQLPLTRSRMSWGLWSSAWSMVIGLWGMALFPEYRLHFLHVFFIAGMGLLTLMVAVRVVLAHGGFALTLEKQSRSISWITWGLVGAALTRLAAGVHSTMYQSHLAYAAIVWTSALMLWAFVFGKKILMPTLASPSEKK